MATSISAAAPGSNNAFLTCPVDVSFDIDDALMMPENYTQLSISSNPFSLVAGMPTVPTEDGAVCSVCMEDFESEGGKQTPCGHVYHSDCISSWFLHNSSCPLCRCSISGDGHRL